VLVNELGKVKRVQEELLLRCEQLGLHATQDLHLLHVLRKLGWVLPRKLKQQPVLLLLLLLLRQRGGSHSHCCGCPRPRPRTTLTAHHSAAAAAAGASACRGAHGVERNGLDPAPTAPAAAPRCATAALASPRAAVQGWGRRGGPKQVAKGLGQRNHTGAELCREGKLNGAVDV